MKNTSNILPQLKIHLFINGLALAVIFGFLMDCGNISFFSEIEKEQKIEEEKLDETFGTKLHFSSCSEKVAGNGGKNSSTNTKYFIQKLSLPYYSFTNISFFIKANLLQIPRIVKNIQDLPFYLILHCFLFYDSFHIS